jgi:hypothetical protein
MSLQNIYKLSLVCLAALCSSKGFSSAVSNHLLEIPSDSKEKNPWFTGPLLAPSAHTIPPKHVNFEPYVFFLTNTGVYNKHGKIESQPHFHSLISQNPIQIGLTPWLDVQVTPQLFYQFTKGVRSTQPGDLPICLDFQILNETGWSLKPAIKLSLKGVIPFGKFENLSPDKLGTDGVGTGSTLPTVALTFSRLFPLPNSHFFAPRLSFSYTFPLSVYVKGLNVYGGAEDTAGRVYPGNIFTADLGMEYNVTQNIALAMDLYYLYRNKTTFSGNPGLAGMMNAPSSEQLSLAPAIEYNWNINVGIIAGAWFSVMGRNAGRFAGSAIAVNLYL